MRVSFLGNRSELPESMQRQMYDCEEKTKDNKGLHLLMCINYSGRSDITKATREIAEKVRKGVLAVEDINEKTLEEHMETNGIEFPDPDLLIRTSGELRVSNYMLWQLAYTELLFVEKLFPDFNDMDLVQALRSFQERRGKDVTGDTYTDAS